MSFDIDSLVSSVISHVGSAGAGMAKSEVEEIIKNLVGDGLHGFPKVEAFLSRLPKVPRRALTTGLLSMLKANENLLGSENAVYIRALNEAVEKFAEASGRAVANIEFNDEAVRHIALNVRQIGQSQTLVHLSVAHSGDGQCTALAGLKTAWAARYPSHQVSGGPKAPAKTIPGEAFPEIGMTLERAMDQATPCPVCMKRFILQPSWAMSTTPAKPKDWVDTLTAVRLNALIELQDAAMEKGGNDRLYVEAAVRDNWSKVRTTVTHLLDQIGSGLPTDAQKARFVRLLDGAYPINHKDAIEHVLDNGARAILERAQNRKGLRGFLGITSDIAGEVWNTISGPVKFAIRFWIFMAVMGFILYGWGWLLGNLAAAFVGTVVMVLVPLPLVFIQKAVDWVADQFRIIGQRIGFNVTPLTDSLVWLKKLGVDSACFFGTFGVMVMYLIAAGWPALARAALVLPALILVVRALWNIDRGFLRERIEKVDVFTWKTFTVASGFGLAMIFLAPSLFAPRLPLLYSGNGSVVTVNSVGLPAAVSTTEVFPGAVENGLLEVCSDASSQICSPLALEPVLPGFTTWVEPWENKNIFFYKPSPVSVFVKKFDGLVGTNLAGWRANRLYVNTSVAAASGSGSAVVTVVAGPSLAWYWWLAIAIGTFTAWLIGLNVVNMTFEAEEGQPDTKRWGTVVSVIAALVIGVCVWQAYESATYTAPVAPVAAAQVSAPAVAISTPASKPKAAPKATRATSYAVDCSTVSPRLRLKCLKAQGK